MIIPKSLITDNDYFSSSIKDEILIIRQNRHILNLAHDIADVFTFYDYLDLVLSNKFYKALVMFAHSEQIGHIERSHFLSEVLLEGRESFNMNRFLNVVNKYILALATFNLMTVFAGKGIISLFYLNIALAHDYRIVADDTVFENPNLDDGLITKGSGYFLPRFLGIRKAAEVLQWKRFSAEDALHLGLIDRIVPESKLEEETMRFVKSAVGATYSALHDIRKLLKCDAKELERSLDLEDCLIKDRLKRLDSSCVQGL